jgi:hypothetical protein
MTDLLHSDTVVGFSISEPPDLVQLGLGMVHLDHVFVELVRHIFAAGGSIAYGGDLRPDGFTEELFDLLRAYRREDRPGPERVLNFFAWPVWEGLSAKDRATRGRIATLVNVPPPAGAPATLSNPEQRSVEERLWFALSLTAMREAMVSRLAARVVIGGRLWSAQGLVPGVAEEAALAIRNKKPLFPAGGFGGCGRLIADALREYPRHELTLQFQLEHSDVYGDLWKVASQRGAQKCLEDVAATINSVRWQDLNNGLTDEENDRLTSTDDVDEVIALVMRGLRRVNP